MLMPEATVDEDHLAPRREDQVWCAGEPPVVQAVSIAKMMSQPPNQHLGFRVLPADAAHMCAPLFPCQVIGHLKLSRRITATHVVSSARGQRQPVLFLN